MTTALRVTERRETSSSDATGFSDAAAALSIRVRGEFREMPGLRLTVLQAARLFGIPADVADAVLQDLRRASLLALSKDGAYSFIGEPSRLTDCGAGRQQGRQLAFDEGRPGDAG